MEGEGSGRWWRFRIFHSVRARITLVAVAVLGTALTGAAASLLMLVHDSLVGNLDEASEVLADEIALRVTAGSLPETIPVPGGPDDDDLVIQVVDRDGRVIAESENYPSSTPMVARTPGDGRLRMTAHLPIDPDEEFRISGRRARAASGQIVSIYVASELEPVQRTEQVVRRAVWVGAPVLLLLSGLLVRSLVGRALRPVESIRRQMAAISESAFQRRVPEPPLEDEVGRLARTANAMLARLERSAERQRRFVSDAAHELRSPLASTRVALEVALAHPSSATWEATAADVLAETDRLERLVENLLVLARGDEQGLAEGSRPVDLAEVARTEADRLRARRRVAVDASDMRPAWVVGVPGNLHCVVRNLFDNAEDHARSAVALRLTEADQNVLLTVSDDGPGVPPDDRERIFDRFVRLDEARARGQGGAGLGLAIVKEIVVAHGGRVTVEDAPGGGATFAIELPAALPGAETDRSGRP